MQFDFMKFLICRAIVENADPDATGADRLALASSLMNMGLVQSAVMARVLAESQATAEVGEIGVARRRSRGSDDARKAIVKVPALGHLSDAKQIEDHLREHRLRSRIHQISAPEIKLSRVARHWPDVDAEVEEESEVDVFLLVPGERGPGEPEMRAPKR